MLKGNKKSFPPVHHGAIRVLSVPDAHHPQQRCGDGIQDLRTLRETQQDTGRGVTTSVDTAAGVEQPPDALTHTHTHTHILCTWSHNRCMHIY